MARRPEQPKTLSERQPPTTWSAAAPAEYGFYANVNPFVHHPRWSQATERRIGELSRRQTLAFNGYGEEVASLTSTRAAQKRMGFRAWQLLHRLSYVVGVLAIIHFVWREKKDIREPLVYGALLALLLGTRLIRERRLRAGRRAEREI